MEMRDLGEGCRLLTLALGKAAGHPSQTKEYKRYILDPVGSDENHALPSFIQQQSGDEEKRAWGNALRYSIFSSPEISVVLCALSLYGH